MFWTNLILLAAFLAMIGGFIWLFRDGDAGGIKPVIVPLEKEQDDGDGVRITVIDTSASNTSSDKHAT
ncbi:hypothetical protein HUU61_20140 [Rhodopseudomonas palustris]|uniref:Uncharacterized protein n=2 Tax=Thiospirillum jenense TaxID=1653858 RepID=A0A839HKX1_9GAMM|nr:hypothetical protein [Rhodopseudomonas palustris]MBB1127268.1 hypothetical protein [Thiospirillum jenense]